MKRTKQSKQEKQKIKIAEIRAADLMAKHIYDAQQCSGCIEKERKMKETEAEYSRVKGEFEGRVESLVHELKTKNSIIDRLEKEKTKQSKIPFLGIDSIDMHGISLIISPITGAPTATASNTKFLAELHNFYENIGTKSSDEASSIL